MFASLDKATTIFNYLKKRILKILLDEGGNSIHKTILLQDILLLFAISK